MVDPVSLRALQIFREERHPSSMGIGVPKEGFSLFGIMHRCVSNMASVTLNCMASMTAWRV